MCCIKSAEGSLKDIISQDTSQRQLAKPVLFKYEKEEKECQFSIKEITMDFNKKLCKAIIIDDHTAFYNLAKLEDKYQKIFVASVAHDIRTPIQGVMGVLDMLDTPNRSEEEKEFIEIGKSTCSLLNCLTHDITDLGQLEARVLKVSLSQFSALEVVNECLKLLSFSYRLKGVILESVVERGMGYNVFSDKHRYMQILINLLGNALKFTFRGCVKVLLRLDMEKDVLITEVIDTGIGIKQEEIGSLFKLFGKLDSSAVLNPQGVGLGLTICKRLTEALGGSTEVKSEFGVGSSFIFSVKINSSRAASNVRLGYGCVFEEEKEVFGTSLNQHISGHLFKTGPSRFAGGSTTTVSHIYSVLGHCPSSKRVSTKMRVLTSPYSGR